MDTYCLSTSERETILQIIVSKKGVGKNAHVLDSPAPLLCVLCFGVAMFEHAVDRDGYVFLLFLIGGFVALFYFLFSGASGQEIDKDFGCTIFSEDEFAKFPDPFKEYLWKNSVEYAYSNVMEMSRRFPMLRPSEGTYAGKGIYTGYCQCTVDEIRRILRETPNGRSNTDQAVC